MELNLDIICDYLPKSIKIQRFGPANKSLSLKFPVLYESACEFERDRLYVARAGTLPRTPPIKKLTVVSIDQPPPQEWINNGCQIILVTESPGLFFVFNEIIKIYEKFNKWDKRLRDEIEAEEDFDINKIIKTGTMIFENPITVVDGNMLNILGTELVYKGDSGEFDVLVINRNKAVPSETIKDACRLERVIKEPYISSVTIDGKKSYCNNLYPFGYFAGCVSVSELNKPFKKSDFALADHFFKYFQKAYAKYLLRTPYTESAGSASLRNILKGIPLSKDEQEFFALEEGEY